MSEQMTQYQKDLVRMWDSLRTEDKGACNCFSVSCQQCPFDEVVCHTSGTGTSFNAEKAIEIVTQWAEEHPIVTKVAKFKETFGFEPKNEYGHFICPRYLGFVDTKCTCSVDQCKKCKDEFWNSEYREPEKEGQIDEGV